MRSPSESKNPAIFNCSQRHIDRLPESLKPFARELVAKGQIVIEPEEMKSS